MRSPMRRRIGTDEVAIAYRVLSLMDGKDRGRRVGALVLDHFNRSTGQCDPSIARIAKILTMGRATVFRALDEEPLSLLLVRDSHGGLSHRNSYSPDWALFRAVGEAFDAARDANSPLPKVSEVRRSRSHMCDVDGLTGETQTYKINLHKKPTESPRTSTRQRSMPFPQVVAGTDMRPISEAKVLAREGAADRALADAMQGVYRGEPEAYGRALDEIVNPELYADARQAEINRKGDGVRMLLKALQGGGL